MAEISNSSVFTNDASSTGASDLLQQAFQEIVDDDDHGNEFVAFLQTDDNDSHTIHLTQEQAAALGLTFEVSSGEEVMYQQDQDNATPNMQEGLAVKESNNVENSNTLQTQDSTSIEQLNFQTAEVQKAIDNEMIKTECIDFQEWHMQKVSQDDQLHDIVETDLSLEDISLHNQQHRILDQNSGMQTIVLEQPKIHTIKADLPHVKNVHDNGLQYAVEENVAQTHRLNSISSSQAQILQKLPVILPSSQFIIKPAQTVLKPAKNIRLLQGSNKITNATVNPINTVHSISTNANANSMLLSKATILNSLSPQILKATPITAQLLNTNSISAQLLNTSQILTTGCDISNHSVNASHMSNNIVNATPGATQNLGATQIRLSPMVKTSQSLQRGGVQQFLTPVLKGATTVLPKSNQVLNNASLATAIPAQFLKSVQIPSQLLKTKTTIGKKMVTTTAVQKSIINSNAPVVLRAASVMKASDLKTTTSGTTSLLKPTQISSPISILKPQAKIAFNNSTKQNIAIAAQNITNCTNSSQNNTQKIPNMQQNGAFDPAKPTQTEATKQKVNLMMNGSNLKVSKKPKSTPAKPATIMSEPTDASKPLGSSENPIQIVQQGQTFHSMQRLTPTQLKQIAHVLQQRSQESTVSNERVVYRVVFPEELDLRIRTPGTLLKSRGGKRGRPKKSAIRPPLLPPKPPPIPDEEQEELKDERKKVVARTRSGRLSRPPRHMVRDYKHLHHLDFLQPDLDDSDGGYSDYNTNNDKIEEEESPKELLTGLEVPKRKISDHFRCPTCNKIYLGRSRMARHFEMHPDHGSPEQLPPPTPEPDIKPTAVQDPLKRKGKKRGPWAYVTPEAKSERRQVKLKEAISVCENLEIIKIAAKPVLDAQSLFDLLVLKSESNVRNFLDELKQLMDKVREKAGTMLTIANNGEESKDMIDISEELLCDALGLNPGLYRINNEALKKADTPNSNAYNNSEPPLKLQKTTDNSEDGKENVEERMSSGFSESSDLSVSDFLNDRRADPVTNPTCPEVLSALTLMRRNPSPVNNAESNKTNNISKLLISNPEIQNQISDNPGFQKVDIGSPKVSNFQKPDSHKEGFTKLGNGLSTSNFCKVENEYEPAKLEHIEQAFIKLEPMEQGFVKLENGAVGPYQKQDAPTFEKIQNGLSNMEGGSQNFAKGFQKLVSKIIPMTTPDLNCVKTPASPLDTGSCKIMPATSVCKISDSIPILQDTVPIISSNCDTSIFGSTENLDMAKIAQYDHIAHLDILSTSGVIDKNLLIDEKLVEQLHLVDQSNLVDELVSERLKNIMPDNILENNLISNNSNLDTDLDFDALSEEFNRNTRS